MSAYQVDVSLVNATKRYAFSDFSEPIDDDAWNYRTGEALLVDGAPDMGAIYRYARAEYGRCTGRVYVDSEGGPPKAIGWCFVSRDAYDDHRGPGEPTYLREAWITVSRLVEPARPAVYEPVGLAS